jgi:colicin import membrane protein
MEPTANPTPHPDEERDALRIQAAAVVAQQAALTDEELRLQQRRSGLERQEEQLANHLEEKRRNLVEMRDQVKTERDVLKEERAEEERKLAARRDEAEKVYAEADQERKLAQKERARVVELRKRLKQRWDEEFAAHEAELRQGAEEVNAATLRLAAEAGELETGRAALADQRFQLNGELALSRRQLEEAWDQLSLAQEEWEASLKNEKSDYEQRAEELAERERQMTRREQELAADKRNWEQIKAAREKEAEGLEARIRNQRFKLQELEKAQARAEAANQTRQLENLPAQTSYLSSAPSDALSFTEDRTDAPVALKRLAGCLADQRVHLLEQWRNVLTLQDQWQQQRETVLTELEDSGVRLIERERLLSEREQLLEKRATQVGQNQTALFELHCTLEGQQARLTASTLEWETERARVLAAAQEKEESAATRVQRARILSRRIVKRHRAEAASLREARRRCDETRQQYGALWSECRVQTETLLREQQALTGETLAVKQLRLEIVGKSDDAAAAEKRLEKLRRQSQTLVAKAEAELDRQRKLLQAEIGHMENRDQKLKRGEERVITWREKLAKRSVKVDERTSALQEDEHLRLQELHRLMSQHELDTRQLRTLRDEVERMARILMGETGDAPSPPLAA